MTPLAIVVLILAIAAAAGALASVAGRASRALDIAAHFAPVWLLAGVASGVAGAAVGGQPGRAAAILSAIAAVVAAGLMAPDGLARGRRNRAPLVAAGQPGTIKVVQLNLWLWNVDIPGTVAWLEREAADVVVLEEVVDDTAGVPAALATAYPHQRADLESGTRVLSRHPQTASGVWRSRSNKTHATGAWATVDHPDGPFTVFGFQATWPIPPGPQQADTDALAARLATFDPARLIVCGDFNATPWSESLRRQDRLFGRLGLTRRTRALFTWPVRPYTRLRLSSPLPFLALDHVYAGPGWETVRVRAGPRLGSDHLPVVVEFRRV